MSETKLSPELAESVAAYIESVKANMPPCLIRSAVIKNQFKREKFSSSQIAAFNYVDLVAFLIWYDNSSIVYENDQLYLKSNRKCVVKPEGIYDLSTLVRFAPIPALMMFYRMSKEAAYFAIDQFSKLPQRNIAQYIELFYPNVHTSDLPTDRNLSYILLKDLLHQPKSQEKAKSIIYSVLEGQYHIDRGIITELLYHRLVAVDENNLDICFLRYEGKHVVGITRLRKKDNYVSYKEIVSMSKRHSGFIYEIGASKISKKYKDLYIFDGVIEILSYVTLSKTNRVTKINNESVCMSACGNLAVELCSMSTLSYGKSSYHSKLDISLYPFLNENPDIWHIWFGFNSNNYTFNENLRDQLSHAKSTNLQEQLRDFSASCGTVNVYTWNGMLEIITNAENAKKNSDKSIEETQ